MPLVLGAAAIAFIFLALLTIITLYWILTKWHNFAQGIPVIGARLADLGDYIRARNGEILNAVIGVAHALISWSVDRINDGFKLLHDIYNAAIVSQFNALAQAFTNTQHLVQNVLVPQINGIAASINTLNGFVHGFVELNINALNFWRATLTHTVDTFIIPQINALISRVDYVTGLQIPTIQARLGVAERTIQQTLPAEIAETKTDIGAVQKELARTTTAPGTGLLDRTTELEKGMAQVLPWAAAIGLSLTLARTLARVARNPCTCLEEDGQTDLLPLVMYLFEEAG